MAVDFSSTLLAAISYPLGRPRLRSMSTRWWAARGSATAFLAGSYPDGITTVEGVPVQATVRAVLRSIDPAFDGLVVAETRSKPDGTWQITGLNPNLKYDVIGRRDGFNDVLAANITPLDAPRLQDSRVVAYVGIPLEHGLSTFGGTAPRSVTLKSGVLPEGLAFTGSKLAGSWPTGATGDYPVVFTVTDAKGDFTDKEVIVKLVLLPLNINASQEIPDTYMVNQAIAPIFFTATGGEGPYTLGTTGALPPGVSFNASTGELAGTPTAGGTYSFSVTATDVRGNLVAQAITVEVTAPIELFDTNLALNKSVDSNNQITYQNSSSGPVNGNINTSNYTGFGTGEAWLSVDLGAIYNINTIKVWFYWLDNRTYHDKRIQYSLDGLSWVSVYDDKVDPVYSETANGKEFVFAKTAARYVRVVTNGSTSNAGNHVIEIETYLIEPAQA